MTDSKRDTRLSGAFKESTVRKLIRVLLQEDREMTKIEARRIFSYGYRILWKNGEELFDGIREEIRLTERQMGLAAIEAGKKRGKGSNKGRGKVRAE